MNTENSHSHQISTKPTQVIRQCTANGQIAPPVPEIARPASQPLASLPCADDLDPKLLTQCQSEADTPPPPLRTRRLEIKARTGSFLQKLSKDQQDQLFLWLAEHSVPRVAEFVAQPPPAGFGMRVQHTTLRRIRAMMATMAAEDHYENSALAADSLAETIDQNRVDFAPVIGDLLLQKTFDLARGETASPPTSRKSSPTSSSSANSNSKLDVSSSNQRAISGNLLSTSPGGPQHHDPRPSLIKSIEPCSV
jgi:hypothetical protein